MSPLSTQRLLQSGERRSSVSIPPQDRVGAPERPSSGGSTVTDRKSFARWVVLVLAVGAFWVGSAYIGPIVLGLWLAYLLEPWTARLARRLSPRAASADVKGVHDALSTGRGRAALVMLVGALMGITAPMVGLVVIAWLSLSDLLPALKKSLEEGSLGHLVSVGDGSTDWSAVLRDHAKELLGPIQTLSAAAVTVFLQFVVLVATLYGALAVGSNARAFVDRHSPLPPPMTDRLVDAFYETGKGLLAGMGLTAVAQAACATVAYWALGVTQPVVFGVLTGVAGLVPGIGTTLVWGPVAAGLFANGQNWRGVVMVGLGLGVIGLVDNVTRPVVARRAKLDLNVVVLLIAMIGGTHLLGAWGLLLGPLVVRLALAGLRGLSAERAEARHTPAPNGSAPCKVRGGGDGQPDSPG
ncbi:MAG: AI-2E family transporter [Polyangiaceae bacterium]